VTEMDRQSDSTEVLVTVGAGADSQPTDAAEEWDALTRAIHGVAEKTHPHVHTLAASLLAGPPEDRMTWSLQVLINGIAHTSTPTPTPTATQDTDRTDS